MSLRDEVTSSVMEALIQYQAPGPCPSPDSRLGDLGLPSLGFVLAMMEVGLPGRVPVRVFDSISDDTTVDQLIRTICSSIESRT